MRHRAVVTGAGGFIGHHLVSYLKRHGYWVRGVDVHTPKYAPTDADEFLTLDLRDRDACRAATAGVDEVYALAADMGGMGYISGNHATILHDNTLIDFQTLDSAVRNGATRFFYASSACIYPEYRQESADIPGLREEEAYPAQPQDAYGWEKLIMERLCQHYHEEGRIQTRVARFHNIYGPLGTWDGGREKAPAAIARKVAIATVTGNPTVEIWGDGEQTRSFCYIDDCVEGVYRLMQSDYAEPLNIGSDRMVTINQLVDIVAAHANLVVQKRHIPGPQGVRGRNSDNTRLRAALGWEPQVSLEEGMARLYDWILPQVAAGVRDVAIAR